MNESLEFAFLMATLDIRLTIWTREKIGSSTCRQMQRLENNFNINSSVNFIEAHFVNSTCTFSKHPSKQTITIKRVIDNGQSLYHPFDVRMAYINENPKLAIYVADDSTQSVHSYDFKNIDIPNLDWINNMDQEDELAFYQN